MTEHPSLQQVWLARLIHLANNPLTFAGVLLTTTGGVSWLFVLPVYLGEGTPNPYLGILFFLVCPAVFFGGLALMPLGVWLRFRQERRQGKESQALPAVNWGNLELRRLVGLVGLATIANIIIGGHYTYAAVEYVDSVSFCGQVCHTVMTPEFTAYQDSEHFRVSCTGCHIGEGASWFVRSKLSGVRQVFAVALNTYSRPIPAPVHELRPARETCEQCHWPQKFSDFRLRVIDKFGTDEQNTPSKTVLMMRIGGGRVTAGIHGFHLSPGVVVEYLSDPSRQQIPWVRYTDPEGNSTEYASEEWNPEQQDGLEKRVMDCIDCHNRPTHTFELPEREIDKALSHGRIDPTLPMVKAHGLEILNAQYGSSEEAAEQIPAALEGIYRDEHPEVYESRQEDVGQAARALLAIYQRNVFPEMKVNWGTYPNHIGHTDFPGCFRCHDDLHSSTDGRTISQDCSSCHELLAMEETDPEILATLGVR